MRFYERNWFLWLSLFLFAPLGIFLLWRYHEDKHIALKIVLSILFAIIFVCCIVFGVKSVIGHHDKKPVKQVEEKVKEEPKKEEEEEEGEVLTFNKKEVSLIVGEASTVMLNGVSETEGVEWTTENPDIAYVESGNANRCTIVGYSEGTTILRAKSSTGFGTITVEVKQNEKKSSASVEDAIKNMAVEASTKIGTNLTSDVKVSDDFSEITFTYWFEGFSGEDFVELTGTSSLDEEAEKLSKSFTSAIKDILEQYDRNPSKTTITVNFLNGTSDEEGYKGESGRQVTNDILFTMVNGQKVE